MTPAGDEVLVTFSVGVDEVLSTRAISDGTTVDKLFYQAFNKQGEAVGEQKTMDVESWPAKPSLTLVTGKEYTVVFWAQKGETYNADDLRAVKIDYAGATNNDESRDAFYKAEPVTVTEGMSATIPVELKRPFAQVNVGVKELGRLEGVTKSQMTVSASSIYSQIDLLTGDVTGENDAPVTFAYAAVPEEQLAAADQEKYIWLSMSYLLVKAANIDFKFSFQNAAETLDGDPIEIDNVPVKPNYRTNLLGSTATKDVEFEVEIDPSYGGSEDVGDEPMGPKPSTDISVTTVDVDFDSTGGTITASYEGEGNVTAAEFIFTPQSDVAAKNVRTRADAAGTIRVPAEVGEGSITANISAEQYAEYGFVAGTTYDITVEVTVDGEKVQATFSGSAAEDAPTFEATEDSGDESELEGDGTKDNPYTVADVLKLYNSDSSPAGKVWVTGTIIGVYKNNQFSTELTEETNLAIGKDKDNNLPVQLPSGDVRTALNLKANPSNINKEVKLYGTIEKYFNVAGVKNVSEFVFEGQGDDNGGDDGDDDFEYGHTGTVNDPFTVAEAIAKAETTSNNTATTESYYIKGVVSSVTDQFGSNTFGNATFVIKDENVDNAFTAYRTLYLDNSAWVAGKDIVKEGDVVIVCGNIVNYNGTPEITANGFLYQYVTKVERPITLSNLKVVVGEDGKSATFTADYTNYSKISISKAGFKYSIENTDTDKNVTAPTDEFGTITATVDNLEYGNYEVEAYIDNIVSVAKAFTIVDPSAAPKTYTLTLTAAAMGMDSSGYDNATNTGDHVVAASAEDGSTVEVTVNTAKIYKKSGNAETDMQWQKTNGVMYNKTPLGKIKTIVINSSAGVYQVYGGMSEQPTDIISGSGTYSFSDESYFKIGITNSATGYVSSVVVTFEK